jgi:branched-chain amino acid transport system permease protein
MTTAKIIAAIGVLALLLLCPRVLPEFRSFQVCLIAATAVVVLGQSVVTGFAGQISLAQSAFAALGGYGATILSTSLAFPFWAALPVAATVVGLVGFLLGQATLRVSGHYLALATMAFTAIVQLALIHGDPLTGGAAGMPVPALEMFGHTFSTGGELFYLILPISVLLFVMTANAMRSRFGRALTALRQSETAAEAMGLDVLRYKAAAFAASGFLGAIGGGMLALLSTYLDPAQFSITQSVYFLAVAVVGGMLSPIGIIASSALFVLLPELLQSFQSYLGLVFALLLLGFVVLRPDGIASIARALIGVRSRSSCVKELP